MGVVVVSLAVLLIAMLPDLVETSILMITSHSFAVVVLASSMMYGFYMTHEVRWAAERFAAVDYIAKVTR